MDKDEEVRETLKQIQEENLKKEETKKEERAFYEKWWFWLILIIVIVMILSSNGDNKNTITSTNTEISTTETEKPKQKNPFEQTLEYDGVYKFVLESDNGHGHIFTSIGAITFSNGTCKAKYSTSSDTIPEYTKEYEGYCGINENDDLSFNFSLNDGQILYKCSGQDKNLSCKLKSEYDLSGCTNNELNLIYVDNSQDIDKVLLQVKEEEKIKKEAEEKQRKEQEEAEFKASCKEYTFEQMARNPGNFKGTNVKLTGEVIQVMQDSYSTNLRVNITKTGTYSTYYTDTIYVVYFPESGEDKILEDDIITIYGTSQGDCSYTTVLGSTVTLPNIQARYITIEK